MSASAESRFTFHPAHVADGINRSGAGFRVVHIMSGKPIGIVAKIEASSFWRFACTTDGCEADAGNASPSREAAALALNAHDLDHTLARIRAEIDSGKITPAMGAKASGEGAYQSRTYVTRQGRAVLASLGLSVSDVDETGEA